MANSSWAAQSSMMIRNLFGNLILVGIIPAEMEGKEPFHLDPYLEVLVDELLCLTDARIYNAYKDEVFKAKVDSCPGLPRNREGLPHDRNWLEVAHGVKLKGHTALISGR